MSASELLYRITLGASLALGLGGALAWRARSSRWARWLWGGGGGAVAALALVAWGVRWAQAGHLPLFGTFESALSLAAAVLVACWGWERAAGFEAGLTPVGGWIAALLLFQGLGYDATVSALTISERSLVVDLHAFAAWAAFAVLAANAGLSAVTLLNREQPPRTARWLGPTLELGFFLHTAMLATGATYRFLLFGRAWSFDPIETLGLVAWVSYGTLLHLHFFAQWRAQRLARWSLGLFALLLVSYRAIVYFPAWSTYHLLEIGLREHLGG